MLRDDARHKDEILAGITPPDQPGETAVSDGLALDDPGGEEHQIAGRQAENASRGQPASISKRRLSSA